MTIGLFSVLAGIEVKTLRYYDEIGVLRPARVEKQNGYRKYDQLSLERARRLKFWKKCGFSLKEIKILLEAEETGEDTRGLIEHQIKVMENRRYEIDASLLQLMTISKADSSDSVGIFRNQTYNAPTLIPIKKLQDLSENLSHTLSRLVDTMNTSD